MRAFARVALELVNSPPAINSIVAASPSHTYRRVTGLGWWLRRHILRWDLLPKAFKIPFFVVHPAI